MAVLRLVRAAPGVVTGEADVFPSERGEVTSQLLWYALTVSTQRVEEGSRDYRDFEDTLMPRPTFDQIKAEGPLSLAVDMDGATHLRGWRDLLDERMHNIATLARSGRLPDVDLSGGTLKSHHCVP